MIEAIIDTNIVIDLLHQLPQADRWFANQRTTEFGITSTIWAEVMQGAQSKSDLQRLIRFLRRFKIIYVTQGDQSWAIEQFTNFYLSHGIEFNDCLIAAVAVRLDVTLYTRNVKHFAPLPSLDEQQPY